MGCCKLVSKASLCLVNTAFLLVGIGTLIVSVALTFAHEQIASAYIDHTFLVVTNCATASIIFIALLGCCGACREKKRYLVPYATLVFAIMLVQFAGVYLIGDFDNAMRGAELVGFNRTDFSKAEAGVINSFERTTKSIYEHGHCSYTTADVSGATIKCNSDAKWFENFVNSKCPVDAATLADPDVIHCIDGAAEHAKGVFCVCQEALVQQIRRWSVGLMIAGISLVALEVLLIIFSCRLICSERRSAKLPAHVLAVPLQDEEHQQAHQTNEGGGGTLFGGRVVVLTGGSKKARAGGPLVAAGHARCASSAPECKLCLPSVC